MLVHPWALRQLPGALRGFWTHPGGAVQAQSLCKWGFRELPRASGQLPGALRSFWARPGGAVQAQSLCKRSFKRRDLRSRPHSAAILSQAAAPVWPSLEQQETSGFPLTPFCNTPAPDMPQLSKSEQTRQPASQPASLPAGQAASQPTPRRLNCGRDHNLT